MMLLSSIIKIINQAVEKKKGGWHEKYGLASAQTELAALENEFNQVLGNILLEQLA